MAKERKLIAMNLALVSRRSCRRYKFNPGVLLSLASSLLVSGCSGDTTQVAIGSKASDPAPRDRGTAIGQQTIKIDRTVKLSKNGRDDLHLHYDSIAIISNPNADEGLAYLILHYQVRNEGKEPFSQATEHFFAIVTDDNTRYTPDSQAIMVAKNMPGLLSDGESNELFASTLQPGLQANRFTAFILPASALSKHLTLEGVGDDSTQLRLSLPVGNTRIDSDNNLTRTTASSTETANLSTASDAANSNETPNSQESDSSKDPRELINEMLAAMELDDETRIVAAQSAIQQASAVAAGNSDEATRLNQLGLNSLRKKNYAEASTLFKAALNADPSVAKYSSNLAYAEMNAGDLESAEKSIYISLGRAPGRSVAWDDFALILAKKGQHDKAVAAFMLANRAAEDKGPKYLESLTTDTDQKVRDAAAIALSKLRGAKRIAE